MRIIICGAGEVGSHAADVLAAAGHDITVIDLNADRLRDISDRMDVGTLNGNGAQADTLLEAGADRADLLVAATSSDESNLLCASIGKGLGVQRTVARVHRPAYFEQRGLDYQKHFGIDHVICPEYVTAVAIARTMRNPTAPAIEHFARGKIDMQELTVSPGAAVLGKTLAELRLPAGARVAAIQRDKKSFIPKADTVPAVGDRLVLVGNSDVFEQARKRFEVASVERKQVIIVGGQSMAIWLAQSLNDRHWSIRLFEQDRALAESLAAQLDWVTVLNADPTDQAVSFEEKVGLADVFVALRDDDEDNIIAGVLAKSLGVPQVIAVVQRSSYLDLLSHVGVDYPFSPRVVAAKEIESLLDDSPIRTLATLADGSIEAYRIRASAKSPVLGQALRDLQQTPDWVIAAIRRGGDVWVPAADDAFQERDVILVIGAKGLEKDLKKILAPK